MSKKIKSTKSTVKLNVAKVETPQSISVSFRYLSKNKDRNFGFFKGKNIRQKADTLEQLTAFLQRLTSKTRADIAEIAKDRDCGFETLDKEFVNCSPNGHQFSENDKITVFRFGDNVDILPTHKCGGFRYQQQKLPMKAKSYNVSFAGRCPALFFSLC